MIKKIYHKFTLKAKKNLIYLLIIEKTIDESHNLNYINTENIALSNSNIKNEYNNIKDQITRKKNIKSKLS